MKKMKCLFRSGSHSNVLFLSHCVHTCSQQIRKSDLFPHSSTIQSKNHCGHRPCQLQGNRKFHWSVTFSLPSLLNFPSRHSLCLFEPSPQHTHQPLPDTPEHQTPPRHPFFPLSDILSAPSYVFSPLLCLISLSFPVTPIPGSSLDPPQIFPDFPCHIDTFISTSLLSYHHASPYLTSPLYLIPCNTIDSFPTVIPDTTSCTAWSVHHFP